ncbi:hypothetical protein F5Y00DRAFT_248680 [Daldinia vernicosa]|uniref:uncharacterized protein n=1 Tax=Daldinia vernicosa TaxID=114800 RepID=UPI00200727CF|nr:uncharacterized protein F5Y00DRAFT_248680 [Daldinia vernicosa]KAI0844473.1 hypothetical protein F5Y00DRAFT_248680 [Daldinia vernicosa]
MPTATDGPTVSLSFANNFWGKDDAGVGPLLDRMASAKQTSDELRSFYSARASIEDEYARKLMSLSRKSLGTHEMGSLKVSLDTMRGEVESMAKQHASIAAQMKTELEEPLAAFAGGMKERRKIVQNTVEKLLKIKIQQTNMVNKTRDRYEQDCLKIKGYLAQGHMVMGQEERKNKARLEKTQISLATTNTEYENAVKVLEETTARWNREWKAAADKFQDLEEERLDFTKSSLWTFANIASTVCVSDDASCEKIRLSLEKMDVEKDIIHFITERGTGQEIPDPPKYINFCRGDVEDTHSEVSEDENYSVAQFPRSINPAFRTSSPQPSTFESHHDPNSALARDLAHHEPPPPSSRDLIMPPPKAQTYAIAQRDGRRGSVIQPQQYPQSINPGFRAPSPQPSTYESHHDPNSALARDLQRRDPNPPPTRDMQRNEPPPSFPRDTQRREPDLSLTREIQRHDPVPSYTREVQRREPDLPMTREIQRRDPNPPISREIPREMPREMPREIPREIPREVPREMPREIPREIPQEAPREAPREVQRHEPDLSLTREIQRRDPNPPIQRNDPSPSFLRDMQRHEPNASFTRDLQRHDTNPPTPRDPPRNEPPPTSSRESVISPQNTSVAVMAPQDRRKGSNGVQPYDTSKFAPVPHDPYPMDGMTMLCRTDGMNSATSSNLSARPSSGDDNSEYSNPTSFSSQEPQSGKVSPVKQEPVVVAQPEKQMQKKKSGFFQNHSPFRRKSIKDVKASNRNTWGPVASQSAMSTHGTVSSRRNQAFKPPEPQNPVSQNPIADRIEKTASPEPIEANASLALNIGQNVFPVANTDKRKQANDDNTPPQEEQDPIAQALAELKGVASNKQAAGRISADHYHGIATPVPDRSQAPSRSVPVSRESSDVAAGMRGTPPPSYDMQIQRLGVPPPAVTSKAMQEASRKYVEQTRDMFSAKRPGPGAYSGTQSFSGTPSRPTTRGSEMPRAASPAPPRGASPRPGMHPETRQSETRQSQRSASPNPYSSSQYRNSPQTASPSTYGGTQQQNSPQAASPISYSATQRRGNSPQPAPSVSYSSTQRQGNSPQPTSSVSYSSTQRRGNSPQPASPISYSATQRRGNSPQPASPISYSATQRRGNSPQPASPISYGGSQQQHSPQPSMSVKRGSEQGYYGHQSPSNSMRAKSPSIYNSDYNRPTSRAEEMAMQLAPVGDGSVYGSMRGRGNGSRPGTSASSRAMTFYDGRDPATENSRQRSQSVADPSRQYTPEGRAILHYARALYMYQAAIPEELGFAKGDILAVLRHQDDGWWEAEIHSGQGVGRGGLVPSNYLQPC